MATVDLTLDQILEAVRQLPEAQRKSLVEAIERLPTPEEARDAARRLRGTCRMEKKQSKRMSELLLKGNAGTLTREESEELDCLAEEFEKRTLDLARAIADTGSRSAPPQPG